MIIFIEFFTAALGIYLFIRELFKNKFGNFYTSIFLMCFVPLFCIYPVIARFTVGGALPVEATLPSPLDDPFSYVVYQLCCLVIIIPIIFIKNKSHYFDNITRHQIDTYKPNPREIYILLFFISVGIYYYIDSTGLSVSELLIASRFSWFLNSNYSSAFYVISTYLISLSPVLIYHCVLDKKFRLTLIILVSLLIFYGALSKDRKWLIFMASGIFAAVYIANGMRINISGKGMALILTLVSALTFWQVGRSVVFDALITGNSDIGTSASDLATQLLTKGDFPYYYNASVTAIYMNLNAGFEIPLGIVRRQLLFFLPASYSFGLKIEDISALFSDALGAGDTVRRGNMPPGFFGLFVLSFGWIGGAITLSLFPFLLNYFDKIVRYREGIWRVAIASHGLSSMLLLLRGDDSSATYFIVFSAAVLVVLRPHVLLRQRRQQDSIPAKMKPINK